jgi:hypothetical protein
MRVSITGTELPLACNVDRKGSLADLSKSVYSRAPGQISPILQSAAMHELFDCMKSAGNADITGGDELWEVSRHDEVDGACMHLCDALSLFDHACVGSERRAAGL